MGGQARGAVYGLGETVECPLQAGSERKVVVRVGEQLPG